MSAAPEMIYLDYAATTPLDLQVAERMRSVQQTAYFNPASNHAAGRMSLAIVEHAAAQLAELLCVEPDTLLWTSGATESNNLAIVGAANSAYLTGNISLRCVPNTKQWWTCFAR